MEALPTGREWSVWYDNYSFRLYPLRRKAMAPGRISYNLMEMGACFEWIQSASLHDYAASFVEVGELIKERQEHIEVLEYTK